MSHTLFKVFLYEDDEIYPFYSLSNHEIEAILHCIDQLFEPIRVKKQFPYMINEDEQVYGMLFIQDVTIMEQYINKKIRIHPPQFGLSPWGRKSNYSSYPKKTTKKTKMKNPRATPTDATIPAHSCTPLVPPLSSHDSRLLPNK